MEREGVVGWEELMCCCMRELNHFFQWIIWLRIDASFFFYFLWIDFDFFECVENFRFFCGLFLFLRLIYMCIYIYKWVEGIFSSALFLYFFIPYFFGCLLATRTATCWIWQILNSVIMSSVYDEKPPPPPLR